MLVVAAFMIVVRLPLVALVAVTVLASAAAAKPNDSANSYEPQQ